MEVGDEKVVFDQVATAVTDQRDAEMKAGHAAVADDEVAAMRAGDAARRAPGTCGQPVEREVIAVERDVVGLDVDGAAAGNRRTRVLLQAPGARGGDAGGQ